MSVLSGVPAMSFWNSARASAKRFCATSIRAYARRVSRAAGYCSRNAASSEAAWSTETFCSSCASSSTAASQPARSCPALRASSSASRSSPALTAACDPGIAGALGEVDVRLRRKPDIAALAGDLREQELVEKILVQLLLGKRRAVFGLGGRGLGLAGVRVGFVLGFRFGCSRLRRIDRASCKKDKCHRREQPQGADRNSEKTC